MVTLQYGSFTALGELVKVVALTTGHSKSVADQALKDQLFLDGIRGEQPGLKTMQCQEWELFLLERLFHNTTAMQRKE